MFKDATGHPAQLSHILHHRKTNPNTGLEVTPSFSVPVHRLWFDGG